jgi:hypothetical protein
MSEPGTKFTPSGTFEVFFPATFVAIVRVVFLETSFFAAFTGTSAETLVTFFAGVFFVGAGVEVFFTVLDAFFAPVFLESFVTFGMSPDPFCIR